MSTRGDAVLKRYKNLCQIPSLVDARILNDGGAITATWMQRNIERGKMTKFSRTYLVATFFGKTIELSPIDISNELLVSNSPSELHRALIRSVEDKDGGKQFFEIWSKGYLNCSIDLAALELHGDVYTDGEFGVLEWSPDEQKLMFIAEKKEPKSEPFYKKKPTNQDNNKASEAPKGEQFLYKEDWGEQYVNRKQSVIVVYDLTTDKFTILEGIPDDLCPLQVTWSPDGTYIAGVVLYTKPRRLGYIYHTNRPSSIFTLDFNGKYRELSSQDKAVRNPRFTPNGNFLIWFERDRNGPHGGCLSLVKRKLSEDREDIEIIVPIVYNELRLEGDLNFYGIYNPIVPKRCWLSENQIVLSTHQKNTIKSYIINITSSNIVELEYEDGSQIVLDVFNDRILINQRNFLKSDELVIGCITADESDQPILFEKVTHSKKLAHSDRFMYSYLDIKCDKTEEVDTFSAIYVGPKSGKKNKTPLIVWPHGGPHSSFANYMFLELSLFNSFGFGVLLVNYRGSTGAGENNLQHLLGKIGVADVEDCVLATKTALNDFPWLDPNRLAIVGGSHGGFLVAHLNGQYPDMFKVAVARNPVTDLLSMRTSSDIPDWCFLETGFDYTQKGSFNEKALQAMKNASPNQYVYKVTAPTLLQVGSKDLRVPPSQSIDYYHRLKANGKIVRMNIYDDNHPIGTVHNELDSIINSLLWIQEHLSL